MPIDQISEYVDNFLIHLWNEKSKQEGRFEIGSRQRRPISEKSQVMTDRNPDLMAETVMWVKNT